MGFSKFLRKDGNTKERRAQRKQPTAATTPNFVGGASSAPTSEPPRPTAFAPPSHTGGRQQHHGPATTSTSSLSGYTSGASEATLAGSGFSGCEQPRSPVDAASTGRPGATAGITSSEARQYLQQDSESSEKRTLWGRIRKGGITSSTSSTVTDVPIDSERKRKAKEPNPAVKMYLRPGSRMVGRYEIFETLGTGYSGTVKKGRDVVTGQYVALKIMRRVQQEDPRMPNASRRLQDEITAMKLCGDHQHTVGLLEHAFPAEYPKKNGRITKVNLLVLELCPNGELFDLLYRGGPVPTFVCKEYFRQLMSGIKYCHDKEVWHRDLKPENLLLDENFGLKIADFGFSASGRNNGLCNSIVGSKTYMAPEVLSRSDTHKPYHGGQADVWSAGVILFTMLSGHPPMEIATQTDWWFRALKLRRHDLFWESHERNAKERFMDVAKDLVNKMLMTDADERITVSEILKHPYLKQPRSARSMLLSRYSSSGSGSDSAEGADVAQRVMETMSERQHSALAAKRMCRVNLADSSQDTLGSGSTRDAMTYSGSHRHHHTRSNDIFLEDTVRSTVKGGGGDAWKPGCVPPEMSEQEAAKVVGGFMASGPVRAVVEAVERALLAMGAEIPALNPSGGTNTRSTTANNNGNSSSSRSIEPRLRSSFKILATLPADTTTKDDVIVLVAKVYRLVPDRELEAHGSGGDNGGVPSGSTDNKSAGTGGDVTTAVVVIRRKGGDYYRYRVIEESLITRLTADSTENGSSTKQNEQQHATMISAGT